MEALMKAISDILQAKDLDISLLKMENERLRKENKELKNDIEKYKENEVKMYE